MKKKIKRILIIFIFIVIVLPYLFVEANTIMFGDDFERLYEQTNMISQIEYYKIFYYTNKEAKVYYVEENHKTGNFVWFEKDGSNWKMKKWETVWSEYGSASGITFPFYR